MYWEGVETANKGKWKQEELERLKEVAERHKGFDWKKISSELGTNRAPLDCLRIWQTRFNRFLKKSIPWTQEEDDRMILVIKQICGDADFLGVSSKIDRRNQMQCFLRWRNTLRPGIKMRTRFRPKEDICLYLAVKSRWPNLNWKQLTLHLDDVCGRGRTDVNARERFKNFMDPQLFFPDFSESEKRELHRLMLKNFSEKLDPLRERRNKKLCLSAQDWTLMASSLRNFGSKRSAYQVKRTWHVMRRHSRVKKKRAVGEQGIMKSKKRRCVSEERGSQLDPIKKQKNAYQTR